MHCWRSRWGEQVLVGEPHTHATATAVGPRAGHVSAHRTRSCTLDKGQGLLGEQQGRRTAPRHMPLAA